MSKRQTPNFSYEVWSINHSRMAALEELRSKMATIAEDEKRLKERLLAEISPVARWFLNETTIIEDLFAYGQAERKIEVGEYVGMNSYVAIRRVLKSLHMAWSGAISVEIGHSGGGLIEVKFRAIGI